MFQPRHEFVLVGEEEFVLDALKSVTQKIEYCVLDEQPVCISVYLGVTALCDDLG